MTTGLEEHEHRAELLDDEPFTPDLEYFEAAIEINRELAERILCLCHLEGFHPEIGEPPPQSEDSEESFSPSAFLEGWYQAQLRLGQSMIQARDKLL